jgi:hypothetical protein
MQKTKLNVRPVLSTALLLSLLLSGCGARNNEPAPINKVVIIIDASISYRKRQAEAVARVEKLLEEVSHVKLKRWEKSLDEISIISLDAMPEVIWRGTLKELKESDPSAWAARFQARSDYANCTSVGEAFRLAARTLDGDSRYVQKYLLAFTDLVDEPPTKSIRSCAPPSRPSGPPAEMPWESLRDISVSVFWVPAEQKLAWQKAVADQGLVSSFNLYTNSESGQVKISPPPRAQVKMSEGEREQAREETKSRTLFWLGVIAAVVVAIFGIFILLAVLAGRRRSPPSGARALPGAPGPGAVGRPASARRPASPRQFGARRYGAQRLR